MLSFLKHIAARIWLTVLLGGVACLWVLPSIQTRIGLGWAVLPVTLILVIFFVLIGWASTRWGLGSVDRLIQEAGVYERDGMVSEAEIRFRQAMAVFDSFLISPLVKKQKSGALTARLARFYLARARKTYDAEIFLQSYLHANPQDEEVAENWIQQIESRGGLKEEHQDLAYRIGSAQPKNRTVQSALARYYLMLERTDFPALQTYRRVLASDPQLPADFRKNLADLFLRERRADEWALAIYLGAIEESDHRSEILKGIAACVGWISLSERNKALLQRAYTYLEGIEPAEIKRMGAGFKPPVPPAGQQEVQRPIHKRSPFLQKTSAALQTFYEDAAAVAAWIYRRMRSVPQSKKARRMFGGIVLAGLTGAVIVLVINTVGHLVKSETPVVQKIEKAPEKITDPFTLQVAAYLEPDYARKFVEDLKKQGLDAYWREAISANKKWYQVRISHFPDKKSARDFGESLKGRGVIEDYYVANFVAPAK